MEIGKLSNRPAWLPRTWSARPKAWLGARPRRWPTLPSLDKLVQAYFEHIYNPAYDATVSKFAAYRALQERCLGRIDFADGDRVLCVGVGTGNEVERILRRGRRLDLVAIDTSEAGLVRARAKGLAAGRDISPLRMDARQLAFADASFDKVVCVHVMDFVAEAEQAVQELMRVLRPGGQFVVTFPCGKEGAALGAQIVGTGVYGNLAVGRFREAFSQWLALILVAVVYTPLYLRPRRRVYLPSQLSDLFVGCRASALQQDWDLVYFDLIISGRKRGGTASVPESDASRRRVFLQPQRGRDLAPVLRVP